MSEHSLNETALNAKLIASMDHLYNQCMQLTAVPTKHDHHHWDTCQKEVSGIHTAMIFMDLDHGKAWDHGQEVMKRINTARFGWT